MNIINLQWFYQPFLSIISWFARYGTVHKQKKALIFIRTVSAVRKGLEPSTSGVTGRRSNQAELPHQ